MTVPKEFVALRSGVHHELEKAETDIELLHTIFVFLDTHCETVEEQLKDIKQTKEELYANLWAACKDIRTLQLAMLDYIGGVADSDQLESEIWQSEGSS